MFTPVNDSLKNDWFYVDPTAMAKVAGVESLPEYYILSGVRETPGGFPIARQWRLDIPSNHMEYAITWYLMALSLLVVYVVYHRQQS